MVLLRRSRTLSSLCFAVSAGVSFSLVAHGAPPGAKRAPAASPAPSPGDTASITFAGFNAFADGTSRLYVRLSAPVAVEPKIEKTTAEYVLHGVRIPTRNNENPLLAAHFSSVVLVARLVPVSGEKKHKKHDQGPSDVRLVVEMREPAHPEHRILRNPDGTATLYVDFPKPSKPPPPEPDPVPPAPKQSSTSQ